MFRLLIGGLFVLTFTSLFGEEVNLKKQLFVYSAEEMEEHKIKCKEEMSSSLINRQDNSYQLQRALATVSGDDADYIPKVFGAGEIFTDENGIAYQLMHNGIKIVLNSYYNTQWLTDVIYALKGHHEPQEEKCFYEVLKYIPENGTMLELGSYWAYYSLWFASEIKGAKNYLIEPNPENLDIGKKNFQLNEKSGSFHLGYLGALTDDFPETPDVKYISIDDFMEKEGIEHLNILHADIQGAEYPMLVSAMNHLDKIDYFFISTHNYNSAHMPCLEFLKLHDYIIIAEHTQPESCSGDGLIVAKRKGVLGPEEILIRKY